MGSPVFFSGPDATTLSTLASAGRRDFSISFVKRMTVFTMGFGLMAKVRLTSTGASLFFLTGNSAASTAEPSTRFGDTGILWGVLMSIIAMSTPGVVGGCISAAKDIFTNGNEFDVKRVYARSVFAKVIRHKAWWNWAYQIFIGKSNCQDFLPMSRGKTPIIAPITLFCTGKPSPALPQVRAFFWYWTAFDNLFPKSFSSRSFAHFSHPFKWNMVIIPQEV